VHHGIFITTPIRPHYRLLRAREDGEMTVAEPVLPQADDALTCADTSKADPVSGIDYGPTEDTVPDQNMPPTQVLRLIGCHVTRYLAVSEVESLTVLQDLAAQN
jgi:hypothetical protein